MIAPLLFALLLRQDEVVEDARRWIEAGDVPAAWHALEPLPESVAKRQVEVEIYWRAGEPAAALAAAEAGLRLAPSDTTLLHRAVSSALWLRDEVAADALLRRLEQAVGGGEIAGEHMESWEAALEDFDDRLSQLRSTRRRRDRALLGARLISCISIGGALATLTLLGLRPHGADRRQPRSDGPPQG